MDVRIFLLDDPARVGRLTVVEGGEREFVVSGTVKDEAMGGIIANLGENVAGITIPETTSEGVPKLKYDGEVVSVII